MIGQHQPVDTGDRHIAFLEAAYQLVHEGVAAAHQHHDVTGLDGAVVGLEPVAAVAHCGDASGQDIGETAL